MEMVLPFRSEREIVGLQPSFIASKIAASNGTKIAASNGTGIAVSCGTEIAVSSVGGNTSCGGGTRCVITAAGRVGTTHK